LARGTLALRFVESTCEPLKTASEAAEMAQDCAKCSRPLATQLAVDLWDGKRYCRDCVAVASPLLLSCVDRFSTLGESIQANRPEVVRDSAVTTFCVAAFLTLLTMALADDLEELAGYGLVMGTIGLVLILFYLVIEWFGARGVRGRVELANGELVVHHPNFGSSAFKLRDGTWWVGKTRDTPFFFRGVRLRRSIMILEFPLERPMLWVKRIRIPSALTDEMHEVWQAFLTLAGVPQRPKRRWWMFWKR
jgi:hypothetical protein